jgi:hypothetical protein
MEVLVIASGPYACILSRLTWHRYIHIHLNYCSLGPPPLPFIHSTYQCICQVSILLSWYTLAMPDTRVETPSYSHILTARILDS